jgi:hypothetical protein
MASWYDSVLSNTVGVVYRAASGNVDPWTLQAQKDDLAASIKQASGPDADPATVAAAQAQAQQEIDSYLLKTDAHPSQAGIRLPGLGTIGSPEFLAKLEKIVYGAIAVGALAGVIYFAAQYKKFLK